jgi:TolB-like protein
VPQVFVSYARSDKRHVARLVAALRKTGFEPWWDDDILPGASWEQTIEQALAGAEAVVVCWSPVSVASENVRSEARVARARGRLVQVFLEPCEPPLFFGERQGIDLTDWNGSLRHPHFERVKQALQSAIASKPTGEFGSAPYARKRWRLRNPVQVVALAAGAIALAALGGWWWERSSPAQAGSMMAVLPIEGLGGGPAVASFADGLTDQITTSLNDGHIPTVSRTDSESLKGADVGQRLKSLNVGYTLNGTAESDGKTLHARLHLDDRVRHASLWSYEASGPADDPMALNYGTARSIAGVISCAYRALRPGGLTDTELLSRYLRACDLFVNHEDATDAKSTLELLDDLRLIASKAPNFTPAHSDLAKFSAYLAPLMDPDDAARARAESARESSRALALDPHSADAWLAREMTLPPTKWAQREALLRKAVAADPAWPHSNGFLAMFLTETGRMREATVYAQRAAAADLQLEWRPFSAKMVCDAGADQSTIADLRQRLSVSPSDPDIQWALRWCLLDSGQYREAKTLEIPEPAGTVSTQAFRQTVENALISGRPADRARAEQLGAKLPTTDRTLIPFIIQWTAALGDLNTAFRLAQQFSPGYPTTGIINFLFSPQTESMRRDPRFFAIAKQYGLADFWRSTGRWPDFCSGPHLNACRSAVAAQR